MNRTPWWAHPTCLFSIPLVLLAIAASVLPASIYAEQWRTWKHFDDRALLIVLSAAAVFSLGAMLPRATGRFPSATAEPEVPRIVWPLFWTAFWLSVAGYVIWFGAAAARGMRWEHIEALAATQAPMADIVKNTYMTTVSGVTTLTQFGMAASVLGCLLGTVAGWGRLIPPLGTLGALAAIRSVLNSERLAVIELVVPALLAWLVIHNFRSEVARRLVNVMPVLGMGLLFVFFTASEYNRSWKSFYSARHDSLIEFAGARLAGYYVTALNNGAALEELAPGGFGTPYHTLNFAWRLPVIKDTAKSFLPTPPLDTAEKFERFLGGSVNIEFNNPGGVFLPIVDFGIPMGLAYWFAAGLICGWLYRHYEARTSIGVCLYPLAGLAMIESARVLYWAEGRSIPSMVWLAVAAWLILNYQRRLQTRRIWTMSQVGAQAGGAA
ncbi:MAG: hypothetical protein SFV51_08755 [Bryobacteraceae bacterium]|nr:hypothetical protein [Bryobacteraceae bacterium]